ncbi:MAG: hypothetical protein K8S54_10235 [Spirochaetia bacterium]|nr:hypothetical protein [Spirochaetia bacterium]
MSKPSNTAQASLLILCMIPFWLNAEKSHEELGDSYYKAREFSLARIEYDRGAGAFPGNKVLPAKSALTLMRENRFRDSIKHLEGDEFSLTYLRMFASLKAGFRSRFLLDQGNLLDSNATAAQKDFTRLLGGTLYLEDGDYQVAQKYFEKLQGEAEDETVRRVTSQTLTEMQKFEQLPRKSVLLAAGLSSILPGSGQIYSGHVADGISSFAFTSVVCGSAAYMNHLETKAKSSHTGSIVTGLLGLGFYLVNITGAVASAQRYNNYQERKFQQNIRERFFNLDFVEKSSGIVFQTNF